MDLYCLPLFITFSQTEASLGIPELGGGSFKASTGFQEKTQLLASNDLSFISVNGYASVYKARLSKSGNTSKVWVSNLEISYHWFKLYQYAIFQMIASLHLLFAMCHSCFRTQTAIFPQCTCRYKNVFRKEVIIYRSIKKHKHWNHQQVDLKIS